MNTFSKTIPLRSAFKSVGIDADSGIIKDVVLVEVGPARGHGVWINDQFIDDVVRLGSEQTEGVKSRFGHPNMCTEALGTYVGRFKNFRKDGTRAIADLHFDESAKETPNGDLKSYIEKLAMTSPDMFGMSIVFRSGPEIEEEEENENGEVVTKYYATIVSLLAADAVDEPAATTNLFSSIGASSFAAKATEFMDENPEFFDLLSNNDQIVQEFLSKYKQHKNTTMETKAKTQLSALKDQISSLAKALGIVKGEDQTDLQKENESLKKENEELQEALSSVVDSVEALGVKVEEMSKGDTGKDDQIAELSKKVDEQGKTIKDQETKISELQAIVPGDDREDRRKIDDDKKPRWQRIADNAR